MNDTTGHLEEDNLLDLAHGTLNATREEPLLAHVRECAACEARLKRVAGDRERFRARGETVRRGRSRRSRARVKRPFGLLVPAIVALAAVAFWISRSGDRPTASPFPWLPDASSLLVTRDEGAAGGDDRLREGLFAYADHEAPTAVEALGRANATGTFESVRRVYLGSALAHAGRVEEAAVMLEHTPLETLPEPWRSQGGRTLAVLWRDAGLEARADSLLAVLARGSGRRADRAREALQGDD